MKTLERLLNEKFDLKDVKRYKKELNIVKEHLEQSTLDIWSKKECPVPETEQTVTYKNYILEFEFAYAGFVNENVDLYHYIVKKINKSR